MSAAASDGGPRRPPFLPAPLLSLQAPGERLSIIRVRVRLQASAEPQGQRWLLSQEGLSSLGMCLPWERSPQPASGSPGSSPAQDSVGTPSSLPCRSVRWPRTLRVPGGNEDPPPFLCGFPSGGSKSDHPPLCPSGCLVFGVCPSHLDPSAGSITAPLSSLSSPR